MYLGAFPQVIYWRGHSSTSSAQDTTRLVQVEAIEAADTACQYTSIHSSKETMHSLGNRSEVDGRAGAVAYHRLLSNARNCGRQLF
jgi:hypothetical protein